MNERQKTFAIAAKVITGGVAKEVKQSIGWIKKHPSDPGLLRKKTEKLVSLFSEESGDNN